MKLRGGEYQKKEVNTMKEKYETKTEFSEKFTLSLIEMDQGGTLCDI